MNTSTRHMNTNEFISISNRGPAVTHTNYFDTEQAKNGFIYASWNAGALRLLLPDSQLGSLADMLTARNVVVSRGSFNGQDAFEVLFDDGTVSPFTLIIDARQSDRCVGPTSHGKWLTVHAYTRNGRVATWQGRFRMARLPCLKPIDWIPSVKSR